MAGPPRWFWIASAGVGVALVAASLGGVYWLRSHGLELGELQTELRRGNDPRYEWRAVDRRHWQALGLAGADANVGESTEETDRREANGAGCQPGMVRVKGSFLAGAAGEVERLQDGACTDWISKEFPARCRTFDAEKIAVDVANVSTRALDFCIDRFEYPNVAGENPMIVVTFREAETMCKKAGKRLCDEEEWTFACEGEEGSPYPYGPSRDTTACVADRPWRAFAEGGLSPRDGAKARDELDRLWQGEPSGSRGACKSSFGVYDMTGNVDEWTRSVRKTGYASVLKGGYWGPVRARCRPATRAHNEDFVAYQQGFRCCGAAEESVQAPMTAGQIARARRDAGLTAELVADDKIAVRQAGSVLAEGMAAAAAAEPAAAEAPAAAAEPAQSSTDDDDDELEAIRRARARVGCGAAPVGERMLGHSAWAGGAVLASVLVLRRRRRG